MAKRLIYFVISSLVILVGVFSLIKWGIKIGIDFQGGTLLELKLSREISTEEATSKIKASEVNINSIQKTGNNTYLFRFSSIDIEKKEKIKEILKELTKGEIEELRFEDVGASFGPELVRKTLSAMLIAGGAILFWIAYQFKSFKFGISAVAAMIHDSLVVVGTFSLLGHFFGAEVDFLFVTAILTILSFSVHDTIVVYDRIRESQKKVGGGIYDLANKAISETMVRSLNNSFTIIFMLVALILLGGSTIRWFSIALLIGTISGTYSSPFVAVPLLVTWDEIEKRVREKRL